MGKTISHYEVHGTIVSGERLGKKIGFPTLNIRYSKKPLLDFGVYACIIQLPRFQKKAIRGIMYFGAKSVGENKGIILEVHALPHNIPERRIIEKITHNDEISLKIGTFIRPPQEFSSLTSLKKQIADDIHKLTDDDV